MDTQRFLEGLCNELQHPEAVPACVKKVVVENWLNKADDLRYVPATRLEGWGMPLKLISEVYEYLTDEEASHAINGASSFVRYQVRPLTDALNPRGLLKSWKEDAMKRQKPDEWAARRLQHWFRRRQEQRLQDLARPPTDDVVSGWLDSHDFSRRSEQDAERRRMERAEAALRRHMAAFVRVWRERRRQRSLAGGAGLLAVASLQGVKHGVKNPHCTVSVSGAQSSRTTLVIGGNASPAAACRRRVAVTAGDNVEVEVWERDALGRKSEILGKATLRVGREHFLPSEWTMDLPLSLPSTRMTLRKATLQVRIESGHAAGPVRIGELPGEPLKGIGAALARQHRGQPKFCPVTELMYRLGGELRREDHEITPLVHRLVTLNWLEEVQDLELVIDRHWELWGFPEKLVVQIKAELLERSEDSLLKGWENFQNNVVSMFTW